MIEDNFGRIISSYLYCKNVGERLAGTIAGMLCFALYLIETIITGNDNYSLWGIFPAFIAVDSIYKGIKMKKKHSVIFGVVWAGVAIVSIVTAVMTFINTGRVS